MARHNPHYTGDDYPTYDEIEQMTSDRDQLEDYITRLHLQPGDVLYISDIELVDSLMVLRVPLNFPVPVLLVPPGGVEKYSRDDLMSMLAMLPDEPTDT
jgi:hypothetical protein